jgi:O-antigen/teichoic acid export membrane protein
MRPLLLLAGLGGVGTFLFADLAVSFIYGSEKFGPAGTILKVFAPGLFLLFVDVLLGAAIVAAGRATALAVAKAVNVLAIVGLELVLIPYFQARHGNGGIGVVVAFAASELMMFGAALLILPRPSLSLELFRGFGRALLLAAGTLLVAVAMPASAPVLRALVAGLTFVALAAGLRLVTRSDLEVLTLALRRRAVAARPPPNA